MSKHEIGLSQLTLLIEFLNLKSFLLFSFKAAVFFQILCLVLNWIKKIFWQDWINRKKNSLHVHSVQITYYLLIYANWQMTSSSDLAAALVLHHQYAVGWSCKVSMAFKIMTVRKWCRGSNVIWAFTDVNSQQLTWKSQWGKYHEPSIHAVVVVVVIPPVAAGVDRTSAR